MKRAVATIKFFYDPETYNPPMDWDDDVPMSKFMTDEEIETEVKNMMLEDINTLDNDGDLWKVIEVEFVEVSDGDE